MKTLLTHRRDHLDYRRRTRCLACGDQLIGGIIFCDSTEARDGWIRRLYRSGRWNSFVTFRDVNSPFALQFGWADWAMGRCSVQCRPAPAGATVPRTRRVEAVSETRHFAVAKGAITQRGMNMASKMVKVEREWLGNTVPTALEMIRKGLDQPQWYADKFGLTPQKALENLIFCIREQAK